MIRVQLLSHRKDKTMETREGGIPPSLRMRARMVLSTLSNPVLISKNREKTFSRGLCRVFTLLKRVRHAS